MFIETLAALAVMSGAPQQRAPQMPDAQLRVAPRGDYRDSCNGEYVNRGRLYADCRTRRGQIQGTSIELNRCSAYEIRNNDGVLTCGPVRGQIEGRPGNGGGQGGGNGGGWGNGRNSLIVYRDSNYRGQSMEFNGEIANLRNTGFNDMISSFRMRGEWEFCTDANFRGDCRTFNNDVTNLQSYNLNDKISSMRPVRRGGGRW
ncbi:MAG TPA: beta/gamma crystallin-related protein [Brevundimonas sp.]|nr:beta/gamma crystallin-related protein [Brevundimonas sp.]